MLDLTTKTAAKTAAPDCPTLADVRADIDRRAERGELTPSTAAAYRAAIALLARKRRRVPETCPAALDDFDSRFPRDGFDPDWHDSEAAYLTWRRRARSSLKGALGVARQKRAVDVEDDWTRLIESNARKLVMP